MRNSWKGHIVDYAKIVEAAKLGSKAFRQRYNTDSEFKQMIDRKLVKSRSKGGAISLKNLGEDGFKKRLEKMRNELVKYKYNDNFGNKFRSRLELKVAYFLSANNVNYVVEPRLECGHHAYYPDFFIKGTHSKIIEVMGIGTERYWKNATRKIVLLLQNYPKFKIAIITSFSKIAKRHIGKIPQVNILRWSELDKLAKWCRDDMPG
jgi:predicted nuclease of restriction endonuclease-like RecB superfamily